MEKGVTCIEENYYQKRIMRIKLELYFFLLLSLAYTSAGGLLILEVIIRLEANVSVLTWFIMYIYHWNL